MAKVAATVQFLPGKIRRAEVQQNDNDLRASINTAVFVDEAVEIKVAHTFDPLAPGAPLILGVNAQGVRVVGFNADYLDGFHHDAFVKADTRAQPNGVATLDGTGKVPAAQLPAAPAPSTDAQTLDGLDSTAFVRTNTLGVAGGVATLDGTGKVPAGFLPPAQDLSGYATDGELAAHAASADHDARYYPRADVYTKGETGTLLAGKSDVGHTHTGFRGTAYEAIKVYPSATHVASYNTWARLNFNTLAFGHATFSYNAGTGVFTVSKAGKYRIRIAGRINHSTGYAFDARLIVNGVQRLQSKGGQGDNVYVDRDLLDAMVFNLGAGSTVAVDGRHDGVDVGNGWVAGEDESHILIEYLGD